MPSTYSKFTYKIAGKLSPELILFYVRLSKAQKFTILGSTLGLLALLKKLSFQKKSKKRIQNDNKNGLPNLRKRAPGVNLEFFRQMKFLLKLMIPKLWSKQIGILLIHTGILITRTFLSIYVAKLEGKIVKEIVQR
jgi:hypothetical protein